MNAVTSGKRSPRITSQKHQLKRLLRPARVMLRSLWDGIHHSDDAERPARPVTQQNALDPGSQRPREALKAGGRGGECAGAALPPKTALSACRKKTENQRGRRGDAVSIHIYHLRSRFSTENIHPSRTSLVPHTHFTDRNAEIQRCEGFTKSQKQCGKTQSRVG